MRDVAVVLRGGELALEDWALSRMRHGMYYVSVCTRVSDDEEDAG